MKAFLVDISAFQIWFDDQGVIRTNNPIGLVRDYDLAASRRTDLPLDQIGKLGLRGQMHVAVPNHARRHHQAGITAHVMSSPAPYSFVRLSKDVYVESPEATLIRMASHLDHGELAVMVNQLLSHYRICNGAIVSARPLSTEARLLQQLKQSKGKRGAKIVRTALAYAVVGTASPAEAKVAALLTLPARWGGKGLPVPEANARSRLCPRRQEDASTADPTSAEMVISQWNQTIRRLSLESLEAHPRIRQRRIPRFTKKARCRQCPQAELQRAAIPWLLSPIGNCPILKSFPSS